MARTSLPHSISPSPSLALFVIPPAVCLPAALHVHVQVHVHVQLHPSLSSLLPSLLLPRLSCLVLYFLCITVIVAECSYQLASTRTARHISMHGMDHEACTHMDMDMHMHMDPGDIDAAALAMARAIRTVMTQR